MANIPDRRQPEDADAFKIFKGRHAVTKIRSTVGRAIILYDELLTGKETVTGHWFDPAYWKSEGSVEVTPAGRGSAWFVSSARGEFVLRHYLRGGLPGKIIHDRYLWSGEENTRPFRESAVLDDLASAGLPVPRVVAAQVVRDRFATYHGKIIVTRLQGKPLSALLDGDIAFSSWQETGRAIAQLHRQLVWHADLNAHNILVHGTTVSLIDFDRARKMTTKGGWCNSNIKRLRRSLTKLLAAPLESTQHLVGWQALIDAYDKALTD